MPASLARLAEVQQNVFTDRATEYLRLSWQTAGQALAAMHQLRQLRGEQGGAPRIGTTSDQDQDLLRAMLVFACAGLDAAMKAVVEDAIPTLADRSDAVQAKLEEHAARRMGELDSVNIRQIGRWLAHPTSPRAALVASLVEELTGGSLQSVEELQRVRAALGIADDSGVAHSIVLLRPAFVARNQISHEMDLTGPTERRTRRHRGIDATVGMANEVLNVGSLVLADVAADLAVGA